MTKPVVHLYTICWDEADMLGFFFRHYDPWVSKYVIFDDGSTDGSREILAAHPNVEMRDFVRTNAESFALSHQHMQDTAWKESIGVADWVVITAIDEHLHVRDGAMDAYLAQQAAAGVTLIPALGFDMNAPVMPDDSDLLVDRVTRGRARSAFNKLSVFKPEAIEETHFGAGRHNAEPTGHLVLPQRDELMLWHYKHLGFERNAEREANQRERLGSIDLAQGFGQHYLYSRQQLRAFWDEMEAESQNFSGVDFQPDQACRKPLWWCGRPTLSRALSPEGVARVFVAPRPEPTVSVLIKAYNHADYIKQSIESVLTQTFQDFEIVLTDDGSTDTTREILKTFTDPRIHLLTLPHNTGISAAMNATIARARGKYFAILNSDDWALPHRLQLQVDFLDAHPDISLLFAMPRPVGDDGEPKDAFNPFDQVLGFPDFSRRTWLRFFFFHHNILCAPTAMIRREAYETAGLYDRRFTNLQDFDMWVRMALAGFNIAVLPDELIALRIRDNNANMSAPRCDSRLRTAFELPKILAHYAHITADDFETLFGREAISILNRSVALRVAEIAQSQASPILQRFAVETYFEHARTDRDFDRLRELAGTFDISGVGIAEENHRLQGLTVRQAEEIAARQREAEKKSKGMKSLFGWISRGVAGSYH